MTTPTQPPDKCPACGCTDILRHKDEYIQMVADTKSRRPSVGR